MRTVRKNFQLGRDMATTRAKITAELEMKEHALKVNEVARLLGVTQQHIYKMAAKQLIPSFRIGGAVRFDPSQVAEWLRRKMPQPASSGAEIRIAV